MKIINKNWQRKIEVEDNIIYTLVFENKKYYRENIIELINQHKGNEGSYILSNDNKEISFDKNSYIITDIFNIDINNKKAQLEQLDIKLNDFEKITKFESCVSFKQYYENKKQEIQSFKERKETIKDQLLELKNNVNIESTNLKHYKQNLDARVEEDKQLTNNIKDEMYRNGFESYEEIEEAISLSEDKSNIEEKINDYNRQYQTYEIEISQLEKLVDGRGLTNLEDIETQLRTKNQELDQINSEVATIAYKHEVNIKNIDKIERGKRY